IYCGAKPPLSELSDEHIIPRNIGGKLVLPKASCRRCARATSQFENECVRAFFSPVRKHLDIRGNKQRKRHSHVKAEIVASQTHSYFEMMPIGEYPSFLWSFLFLPPGILVVS
ncbi:MAG TPA: HNH endonuclease, partial [Acetobacteraceae bacterium]|nr:HNH endonuclease [Acetobacteraceae bacterium]